MTYDSFDLSVDDGEPVELYEFFRGDFWAPRFTTAQQDIVSGNWTYEAAPIKRSRMRQGDNVLRDSIEITLPRGHEIAREIIGQAQDYRISITIKRMHRAMDVSGAVIVWMGHVTGADVKGMEVEISCRSVHADIKRRCLAPKYETICRHPLWTPFPQCNATKPAHRADGEVILVDGNELEILAAASQPDGWWIGGELWHQTIVRTIVWHVGDRIRVNRLPPGLIAGHDVVLYPGCDKLLDTCINKFSNGINFGGFAWLPGDNPFHGIRE